MAKGITELTSDEAIVLGIAIRDSGGLKMPDSVRPWVIRWLGAYYASNYRRAPAEWPARARVLMHKLAQPPAA